MAKNVEYKVLKGLDYPPNKRAEVGDVVSDLPKESISWLVSGGYILLNDASVATTEKIVEEVIEALSDDLPLEEVITDGE